MAYDQQAIATLAAGIVIARSARTVLEIKQAWRDAQYIACPEPGQPAFVEWAKENGLA